MPNPLTVDILLAEKARQEEAVKTANQEARTARTRVIELNKLIALYGATIDNNGFPCSHCIKVYNSKAGLGIHKAKTHNIAGEFTAKNAKAKSNIKAVA